MKICQYCGKGATARRPLVKYGDIDSASGPGAAVYRHPDCKRPKPHPGLASPRWPT